MGPVGSWRWSKSAIVSEPFCTSPLVIVPAAIFPNVTERPLSSFVPTEPFFSSRAPMLFTGNAETAAMLVPVRATNRATSATPIAGLGR